MNNGQQGRGEGWHILFLTTIVAQSDPSATAKKAAAQELAGTHYPSVIIAPLALTQFPKEQPSCHGGTLLVSGC